MNYFGKNSDEQVKLIRKTGYNDADGNVFCGLCKWTEQHKSLEQIEFRLAKHLLEAHGVRLTHKQSYSGKEVQVFDVPPIEDEE